MKKLTAIVIIILLMFPVCSSYALFGQKQARAAAENRADHAKAELQNVKQQAEEAKKQAEDDQQALQRTFVAVTLLLSGGLVYALTYRKTVHQTVQQVVNVQAPAPEIVAHSLVIDGTNIVRYGDGDCTSLLRLLGVLLELEKKKYTYKCYFDASTFYVLKECGLGNHAWAYRGLIKKYPMIFVEVPGRTQADDAILDYAQHHGTPIISNDQYREYKEQYQWLADASKWRVPFVVHPTMVQLYRLKIHVKIPCILSRAIAEFDELLKQPRELALSKSYANA